MTILDRLLNQRSKPDGQDTVKLYHYLRENEAEKSRIHLRVDGDGHGTLIVNANRVMHLNPTGTMMAKMLLEEKNPQEITKELKRTWRVRDGQVKADLAEFQFQLEELLRPDGVCAIHDLELETTMPFSARPSAPYRMDLALTYRCQNDCPHCYVARPKDFPDHGKSLLSLTIAELLMVMRLRRR